jgi:hypothetical protein
LEGWGLDERVLEIGGRGVGGSSVPRGKDGDVLKELFRLHSGKGERKFGQLRSSCRNDVTY